MVNEAFVSVTGYIATQPRRRFTTNGTQMVTMRVGWTPRIMDRKTGEWVDQQASFVSVVCYRKVAENAAVCLRRGDPVLVKGRLQVREYADQDGVKRLSVDVVADTLGHDMSRGTSLFARTPQHVERTALEHEQAMAAAGGERTPLPGDRRAGEVSDDPEAGGEYRDDYEQPEGGPDSDADSDAGAETQADPGTELGPSDEGTFGSPGDEPNADRRLALVGAVS